MIVCNVWFQMFQIVEKPDLCGLEFLWETCLNTPNETIAEAAIELLLDMSYSNLTPKMKKVKKKQHFLSFHDNYSAFCPSFLFFFLTFLLFFSIFLRIRSIFTKNSLLNVTTD